MNNLPPPERCRCAGPTGQSRRLNVLTRREVELKSKVGRTLLYEKGNPKSPYFDPTLPVPIRLSASSCGFFEHEIDEWLLNRPRTGGGN